MLLEQKTFDTATAAPLGSGTPPASATTAEAQAAAVPERRAERIVLAVLLAHIGALVASLSIWGGPGLFGWALASTVLAGCWVLSTTRGVPTSADD